MELNKTTTTKKVLIENGGYYPLKLGFEYINPNEISTLSRVYEEIKDDKRMKKIEESVENDGWKDNDKDYIELLWTINKGYLVGDNGNHRSLLAKKMGYEKILVFLKLIIPIEMFTIKEIEKIKKMDDLLLDIWNKSDKNYSKKRKKKIINTEEKLKQKKYKMIKNILSRNGIKRWSKKKKTFKNIA